jgi:hypothetical protein
MRQVVGGRMYYIEPIRDDISYVLGRPALIFRGSASEHKEEFIMLTSASATKQPTDS